MAREYSVTLTKKQELLNSILKGPDETERSVVINETFTPAIKMVEIKGLPPGDVDSYDKFWKEKGSGLFFKHTCVYQ